MDIIVHKFRGRGEKIRVVKQNNFDFDDFISQPESDVVLTDLKSGDFIYLEGKWKVIDNIMLEYESIRGLQKTILQAYIITTQTISDQNLIDQRQTYYPNSDEVFKVKRFLLPLRK